MEIEIIKLIAENEDSLSKWIEKRDSLRNKILFCFEHKFEEEVRISQSKLYSMEGIIYDYELLIENLKTILKKIN